MCPLLGTWPKTQARPLSGTQTSDPLLCRPARTALSHTSQDINVWLPLAYPLLGAWPETQTCALRGNQTSDPLVRRPVLSPLSHTSQGLSLKFWCVMFGVGFSSEFWYIPCLTMVTLWWLFFPHGKAESTSPLTAQLLVSTSKFPLQIEEQPIQTPIEAWKIKELLL